MPSRKLTAHCPQCGCKNHLRACHCNQCGLRLKDDRVPKDEDGRSKLYADIAHPINSACREMIQDRVIKAFHDELERAKLPGYASSYDDFDEDMIASPHGGRRQVASGGATKVEPAEAGPRGPHISPSADKHVSTASIPRHAGKSSHDKPKRNDGFGAGIL
jgi:stage V sporulation protein G